MAKYLGNSNTKEVHNLDNQKAGCSIDKIKAAHRVYFDTLGDARAEGYDNCHYCIGGSTR